MAAPDSSFMVPTLSTSSDPLYHDMAILERSSSKGALQKRRQQTLSCAECRRLKLKCMPFTPHCYSQLSYRLNGRTGVGRVFFISYSQLC